MIHHIIDILRIVVRMENIKELVVEPDTADDRGDEFKMVGRTAEAAVLALMQGELIDGDVKPVLAQDVSRRDG